MMNPSGDKFMSVDVREKLRELINTQYQQVLSDPNKFTALMLDLCLNTNEREINILATALTNKIPQHLQSSGSTSLTEELSSSLSYRLENETGLSTDSAHWAVNTWAEALGMVTVAGTRTKDTGKQVPPPELKTTIQPQPEVKPVETPVIGVDCTVMDFGKVIPGTIPSKTFTVRNHGTGILMGKVSTSNSWIDVSPKVFDVSGIERTITITIDSSLLLSLLSPERHPTGYINIESNGGPAKIEIKATAAVVPNKDYRGKNTGENRVPGARTGQKSSPLSILLALVAIVGVIIIGVVFIMDQLKTPTPAITTTQPSDSSQAPAIEGEHLIDGLNYSKQLQWDAEIVEYTKAIEIDPALDMPYYNRGNAYYYKGDYDKAIADYTRAIELNPQYTDAYNNRGLTYYNKGDYDKAIVDCTTAIEMDPKYVYAYANRGLAYNDKGDYDKAIVDCTTAIEMDPKLAGAYLNRGRVYFYKGDYDKAIADSDRAIELDPKLALAYNCRGASYQEKREYDKAIADYTKTIALEPNFAEAYNNRGRAYFYKGAYDKAITDFDRAIELDPKLALAYNGRGASFDNKGEHDKAIAEYTKTIALEPNFAAAYSNRGHVYYKKDEYDKAIADCSIAIELDPKLVDAYICRGAAYYKKGDYDKTIVDCTTAIKLDPMDVGDYNRLPGSVYQIRGLAYQRLGKWSEGQADVEKAKELGYK